MSGTVTGLDLDRLEALAKKATPGPWESDGAELYATDRWDDDGTRTWVGETLNERDSADDDAALIAELRNAAPSLLAAARAVQAVRLAVHLDDDDPINTREAEPCDDDWQRAAYEDGWDAAVDHMRGLVRAALGTEQEGQQ